MEKKIVKYIWERVLKLPIWWQKYIFTLMIDAFLIKLFLWFALWWWQTDSNYSHLSFVFYISSISFLNIFLSFFEKEIEFPNIYVFIYLYRLTDTQIFISFRQSIQIGQWIVDDFWYCHGSFNKMQYFQFRLRERERERDERSWASSSIHSSFVCTHICGGVL